MNLYHVRHLQSLLSYTGCCLRNCGVSVMHVGSRVRSIEHINTTTGQQRGNTGPWKAVYKIARFFKFLTSFDRLRHEQGRGDYI
jgi:hypothetical protein